MITHSLIPEPHLVRRGTGTPVLFVHGNGVDHRDMLDLDPAFERGSWERLYPDLPGFGETAPLEAPGGLPELADWLDRAVGELLGSTPFAVVGTSLGGLLARDLVARRREQCLGMALLVPVVDSVRANRTLPEPVVLAEDPELVARLSDEDAAAYLELAVVQSPENWERFRRAVLPGIRAANVRAMARLEQSYALPDLPDERVAGFDRPVLIVAGRQDAVVGFEDQWTLAQRFPHATYALLDRAGHNASIDAPDAVRDLLREWAGRVFAAVDRAPA